MIEVEPNGEHETPVPSSWHLAASSDPQPALPRVHASWLLFEHEFELQESSRSFSCLYFEWYPARMTHWFHGETAGDASSQCRQQIDDNHQHARSFCLLLPSAFDSTLGAIEIFEYVEHELAPEKVTKSLNTHVKTKPLSHQDTA